VKQAAKIPVVAYHSIANDHDHLVHHLSLPLSIFERQLQYLHREGFQAVTLYDVATYSTRGSDGKTPWERLMALPLRQVPFFQTLWRNVPFGAILLGNASIGQLPTPRKPDGTLYSSWSDALTANGGSTTDR